uniref:Uncharacterized protein n=1 Tax=Leersia perrieri TaxID=77586 RepID=A0A0D9WT61_9ORYZ
MAKNTADSEKATGVMDAAAQVDQIAVAGGEEEVVLIPADPRLQVQRGDAGELNQDAWKKWLGWFLIVVWVMILTNNFFVDEGGNNNHAESGNLYAMLAQFISLRSDGYVGRAMP